MTTPDEYASATHVITLVAPASHGKTLAKPTIDAATFSALKAGFRGLGYRWLSHGEAVDVFLIGEPGAELNLVVDDTVDVFVQPLAHRRKKLLISDMDSTIIQQECIDELAEEVGLKDKVSHITERAMNGELDFKDALRERVALLKGLEVTALERVYAQRIQLMPGAKELVATMRAHGARALLVSGGFTYFTGKVREAVGFDEDHANILNIAADALDGTVAEPILDKESKLVSLKESASALGIGLEETLAIGDGANDLPMLQAAGLGIAYHAKPVVRAAAKASIAYGDLTAALYAQGYKKEEWAR